MQGKDKLEKDATKNMRLTASGWEKKDQIYNVCECECVCLSVGLRERERERERDREG